jgi:hypothetical protein
MQYCSEKYIFTKLINASIYLQLYVYVDYVAHMWRRVALSSKETLEQLISYQAAIEALNVGTIMTKKV